MERMPIDWILRFCLQLAQIAAKPPADPKAQIPKEEQFDLGLTLYNGLAHEFSQLGWVASATTARKVVDGFHRGTITYEQLHALSQELVNRLNDELREQIFLYVSGAQAAYLRKPTAGWEDVIAKLPDLQPEIEDATKCLAFQRATATVFHLMRVMEVGLQRLGKKLGLPKSKLEERNWHNILNDVNAKINALQGKTPSQKSRRQELAQLAAHLSAVKLAWRNPTMHPRSRYTVEESKEIYNHSRLFMTALARVL